MAANSQGNEVLDASDRTTSLPYTQDPDSYTHLDEEATGVFVYQVAGVIFHASMMQAVRTVFKRRIPIPGAIKEPTWDSQVNTQHFRLSTALNCVNAGTAPDLRATPAQGHSNSREVTGPQEWPAETNLQISSGKLKLTDQSQVIRDAVTDSFPFLRASIILQNVFPDPILTGTFILRALLSATDQANHPNAADVRRRILHDHVYFAKISTLVRRTTHFLESL